MNVCLSLCVCVRLESLHLFCWLIYWHCCWLCNEQKKENYFSVSFSSFLNHFNNIFVQLCFLVIKISHNQCRIIGRISSIVSQKKDEMKKSKRQIKGKENFVCFKHPVLLDGMTVLCTFLWKATSLFICIWHLFAIATTTNTHPLLNHNEDNIIISVWRVFKLDIKKKFMPRFHQNLDNSLQQNVFWWHFGIDQQCTTTTSQQQKQHWHQ